MISERSASRCKEHAARELLTSDGWKRWIGVRASKGLARYSLRNQWLIALECHRRGIVPTYVAGFRAFLALNRCVRKGERAIRILAPVVVRILVNQGAENPPLDSSRADGRPSLNPVPLAPERAMSYLTVELDQLTAAERRDLANALLRAAWSAVLQETRVALFDLLVEVDDSVVGGPA